VPFSLLFVVFFITPVLSIWFYHEEHEEQEVQKTLPNNLLFKQFQDSCKIFSEFTEYAQRAHDLRYSKRANEIKSKLSLHIEDTLRLAAGFFIVLENPLSILRVLRGFYSFFQYPGLKSDHLVACLQARLQTTSRNPM
jgi:hypothetical protein